MSEYLTITKGEQTIYLLAHQSSSLSHLTALVAALAPIYREHKVYCIRALRAGGDAIVMTTVEPFIDNASHHNASYRKGLSLKAAMCLLEQASDQLGATQ